MNKHEFFDASGNLDREAVRAHFSRVGKLDGLTKGDDVWVDYQGQWVKARLIRRIPGDCWIAKLHLRVMGMEKVTVTVSSFGGKVAE